MGQNNIERRKSTRERRHDKRIEITEAGFLVSSNNGKKLIPVKILNVSFNGIGLVTDCDVKKAECFTLQYSIFHRFFSFPVKIMWSNGMLKKFAIGCMKAII